jgi:hypothetical protein
VPNGYGVVGAQVGPTFLHEEVVALFLAVETRLQLRRADDLLPSVCALNMSMWVRHVASSLSLLIND